MRDGERGEKMAERGVKRKEVKEQIEERKGKVPLQAVPHASEQGALRPY